MDYGSSSALNSEQSKSSLKGFSNASNSAKFFLLQTFKLLKIEYFCLFVCLLACLFVCFVCLFVCLFEV